MLWVLFLRLGARMNGEKGGWGKVCVCGRGEGEGQKEKGGNEGLGRGRRH